MSDLLDVLQGIYGLDWLYAMQHWLPLTVIGAYIVLLIAAAAFASVRMGLSPLWTLLLIVPFVQVAALAGVAYVRWPRVDGPRVLKADPGA